MSIQIWRQTTKYKKKLFLFLRSVFQSQLMGSFRRILLIKECYHKKNNCKVSNFSSLKTNRKIIWNIIRYYKKDDIKFSNFSI